MYDCYFGLLIFVIILFGSHPTSDIGVKVRVEAMAGEEGKVLGIEKFDETDFGY